MGFLYDQGLFSFDDKIAKYWPEFAQNCKENITIADVGRHDCNLHKLDKVIKLEDIQTD